MKKSYHESNKTFMIYKDWEECIGFLGSDEDVGKLFKALFAFASRGELPEFNGALAMAFGIMKNSIERDGLKWEKTCSSRSEAGKKGGRPAKKKAAASSGKQKEAKKADKDTVTDTDTEKDTDTVKVTVPSSARAEETAKTTAATNKYSEFVCLEKKEYDSLVSEYGKSAVSEYFERYDGYIKRNDVKPYANSYRTLKSWLEKDKVPKKSDHSFDLDKLLDHALMNPGTK